MCLTQHSRHTATIHWWKFFSSPEANCKMLHSCKKYLSFYDSGSIAICLSIHQHIICLCFLVLDTFRLKELKSNKYSLCHCVSDLQRHGKKLSMLQEKQLLFPCSNRVPECLSCDMPLWIHGYWGILLCFIYGMNAPKLSCIVYVQWIQSHAHTRQQL